MRWFGFILSGLFRSALAFCAIMVVNYLGSRVGFSFPLNVFNASLIGFCGIPGAVSAMALGMII